MSDQKANGPRISEAAVPMRAAVYVRMSTEHQRYSTTNQLKAISEYAALRGIEIAKVYEDAGRSGLTFDGRDALKKLFEEITRKTAVFTQLLVYDVSRWGRYQDADESAYYEHICRRNGVNVIYCAEPFENDGSPLSVVLKNVKRAMAAEFSRELSVKVFATQSLLASQGKHPGSYCVYGLKRVAVDEHGRRRKVLKKGHRKDVPSDHVVLAPGSRHQIAIVNEIFDKCVNAKWSARCIARSLNSRAVPGPHGKRWNYVSILHILRNDKYIGTQFYNRTSCKLKTPRRKNDQSLWVEKRNAFKAIVDLGVFQRAQEALSAPFYQRKTDEELLADLRDYIETHGTISTVQARAYNGLANNETYKERFGSLRKACELAGYTELPNNRNYDRAVHRRQNRSDILLGLSREVKRAGVEMTFTPTAHRVRIGEHIRAYFELVRTGGSTKGSPFWRPRFVYPSEIDLYIFGRLLDGQEPIDYYAIPRCEVYAPSCTLHLSDRRLDAYRFPDLRKLGASLAASCRSVLRGASKAELNNLGY